VHIAFVVEDLRHAYLFSQNPCNCHVFLTSSCGAVCAALPELNQFSVVSYQSSVAGLFLTTDN
jgi:hypothetical protein